MTWTSFAAKVQHPKILSPHFCHFCKWSYRSWLQMTKRWAAFGVGDYSCASGAAFRRCDMDRRLLRLKQKMQRLSMRLNLSIPAYSHPFISPSPKCILDTLFLKYTWLRADICAPFLRVSHKVRELFINYFDCPWRVVIFSLMSLPIDSFRYHPMSSSSHVFIIPSPDGLQTTLVGLHKLKTLLLWPMYF